MNPAVPRRIPVLLDALFPILTLPTLLRHSLLSPDVFPVPQVPSLCYSDTPYSFPTHPIQLGFPEHTTRARSLPIQVLLALPLS